MSNVRCYLRDAVNKGPGMCGEVLCDGLNDYANRIAKLIATIPSTDYVILFAAFMNVLDILEKNQPGLKVHAMELKNLASYEAIVVSIPIDEKQG